LVINKELQRDARSKKYLKKSLRLFSSLFRS